jgi:flagellar protein FliL
MSKEAPAPAAEAGAETKKKKKPIVLIALVAVLLLAGGGGAGAYFFMKKGDHGAEAPPPPPEPGIAALDSFVVNLADPGGQRFIRLTLRLVLETKEAAEEIKEDELALAKVRSTVLELLTLQMADQLVTPEGKAELKKQIAERATHALGHTKVLDVLFTEFVVQF